ncbi:MAG: hypothetical protein ACXQTD_04255 [Candidatus Syntropharchaeia archaeon]
MLAVELTTGEHEIEFVKDGYEVLAAKVDVTDSGVSCISVQSDWKVIPGGCDSPTPPGVVVSDYSLTAYLQEEKIKKDICSWIEERGGRYAIGSYDITELILTYVGIKDLGFKVTSAHVAGAIMYYNKNIPAGDALTGCGGLK